MHGHVPVIFAKDETKVKSRIVWEASSDTLVGFCGSMDSHCCVSNFKPVVGCGNSGYEAIVDAFRLNKKGSFTRVIMVNPLHALLPRLILVVSCTCNCFDFDWVRRQWSDIDHLWKKCCAATVGPIISHASDGDSRRRQIMLQDYSSKVGSRYAIP